MYTTLTTQNRSILKRFSHRARFRIAVNLLDPGPSDRILDYGTGDGFLLRRVHTRNRSCHLVGYEPHPRMYYELQSSLNDIVADPVVKVTSRLSDISGTFTKIGCLEVMEHLTEADQLESLAFMRDVLNDDGRIIISVPIEVGLSSVLKNLMRIFLRQCHENTNIKTVLYSALNIRFDRGSARYNPSHMGFYYPDLETCFARAGLEIRNRVFSPIGVLRGWMNSQVFFVLTKRHI